MSPAALRKRFGGLTLIRTTAKATLSHYRPRLLGADHQWKIGGASRTGRAATGPSIIPTGVRFVDNNGRPFQAISSDPSMTGGSFITAAAFASDAITVGDRLTINAGVRFDHSRAISQDLHALDPDGRETDAIIHGLGTLYTWNLWSPRLGVTMKLTADGRTMLRGSYGRFSQGVLTGEFSAFHPGVDADHDHRVRSGDRRLHAHRLGRRFQEEPAPRSRNTRAAHRRVLHWRGSRGRSPARGGDRLRPQGWRRLHRLDGCRRSVS